MTLQIINDRLVGATFKASPNTSRTIKEHLFLVVHQDFGTWEGTTSWITGQTKVPVSYHLFISKTGEVRQFVDLNKRAFHAGKSSWKGKTNLNDWGIGVCFQNLNNEPYTEAQIVKGVEVCKFLMQHYGYKEIVRHKDISPGRKFDPEPPFPWESFKAAVLGKDDSATYKTTTSGLNLRTGPGTSNKSLLVIPKGGKVQVHSEASGWASVTYNGTKGFVSTQYLK